jgi:hypothetical protein
MNAEGSACERINFRPSTVSFTLRAHSGSSALSSGNAINVNGLRFRAFRVLSVASC